MQYEAAKPKGVSRNEDAPKQEPMRGSDSQVRRNPSTDQKKVRRQMAKKSAYDIFFANSKIAVRGSCINCGTNMVVPENSSFPKCDNCTKNDPAVGTPDRPYDREKDPGFTGSRKTADRNLGYGDFDGPDDDDDDDDEERDEDHLEYNPLDEIEKWERRASRKTPNNKTTSSNKNATLIPTQVQNLTPQDYILHPITQGNEKIRRTRSFETQGDEAYVDTDSGTSSPVKRNQTVVRNPYNMSQIELPSTGIPGGNSNVIPFGRQHDPSANKPSAKESKCPRDGTMMTLQKGGNTYKCSTCGLVEKVRGAGGLNFSDAPSVNKAAIKNNRRTASAIAQRARQVLDLEENQ